MRSVCSQFRSSKVRPPLAGAALAAGLLALTVLTPGSVHAQSPARPAPGLQFDELKGPGFPELVFRRDSLAVGDIDGDGDVDTVFGVRGQRNQVVLNTGRGTFEVSETAFPLRFGRTELVDLVDVDSDGDLDLLDGEDGGLRLFLNDGTGQFSDVTVARMPAGVTNARELAIGDVDQDGDLDLLVARALPRGDLQNRLLINDGSGNFTDVTSSNLPTLLDASRGADLADVDGDGDLDAFFANGDFFGRSNRLLLNDGSGVFVDAPGRIPADIRDSFAVVFMDVEGDGDPDLVIGNQVIGSVEDQNQLYLNDGTGNFVDVSVAQFPGDRDITAGFEVVDLDADGDQDLVVVNSGNSTTRVLLNDGAGTFTTVPSPLSETGEEIFAVDSADYDGDGDVDLMLATRGREALWLSDGAGGFSPLASLDRIVLDLFTSDPVFGDFDGDGDVDVFTGFDERSVDPQDADNRVPNRLFLNRGDGFFDEVPDRIDPQFGATSPATAAGDVDGDGDIDLISGGTVPIGVAGPRTFGPMRLFLNDGAGNFSSSPMQMPGVTLLPGEAILVDVDSDLDLDLVIANRQPGSSPGGALLFLNDGTGFFSDATGLGLPTTTQATEAVDFADIDGDGDFDLAFAGSSTDLLYLNDGTGTFSDVSATRLPSPNQRTDDLRFGDLDGDGSPDLYTAMDPGSFGTGVGDRLFLNDGSGNFTDASFLLPGTEESTSVDLGDIDGEGSIDIVLAQLSGDRVLLNNGTGFVDATSRIPNPSSVVPNSVHLVDLDQDGDLDFLSLQLFMNLLRQTQIPLTTQVGGQLDFDVYARFGPPRAFDAALPLLSFATGSFPSIFGFVGIDLSLAVSLPPFFLDQTTGFGSLSLPIPNLPGLVGVPLFVQTLLGQDVVGIRFTNVAPDVIR